jgi:hypothetical protein
MASKYWVGGDGNWSSLTNWRTTSGGAVVTTPPILTDAAVLDANSSTSVVTVDSNITVQTLTCTGFTGTLAFGTNTISLNSTGTIFTGATTMTVTGTPLIICTNATATARTISPAVVTEANSISFRITAGTGSFAITTTHVVRDLDFTDGTNPTGFAGNMTATNNSIYGNFKASTGMTFSATGLAMNFVATSGVKTINSAGVTIDRAFTFSGVGGTFQLQAALTSGATRTCTLTNGTLDLNGYTLTTGLFSSTNSNVRTLAFGTGKIVLTATSGTIFTAGVFTNLTVTGTSLVQATNGGAGTRTITLGTGAISETNSINFAVTAGSDIVSFAGTGGAAQNIDLTGFSGTIDIPNVKTIYGNLDAGSSTSITGTSIVTFAATSGTKTIRTNGLTYGGGFNFNGVGGTWTMQDALTLTGTLTLTNGTLKLAAGTTSTVGAFATSGTNQKYLQSSTAGTQATISDASGTNTVSYLTIQDINATGGATWNSFYDQSNINAGNNAGWYFGDSPTVGNEIEMRLRSFTQPRRF